jgi:hypothetical protein
MTLDSWRTFQLNVLSRTHDPVLLAQADSALSLGGPVARRAQLARG